MINRHQTFQRQFFERLSTRFPSRSEMVEQISQALCVGRDAVYRRMRGDTSLTADELVMLARKFNIRLEEDQRSAPPALLFPIAARRIGSEVDYFREFREHTRQLVDLPEVTIDYATSELPIFYELSLPLLAQFKTFMFGITTWHLPKWQNLAFTTGLIHPDAENYFGEIVADSCRIPGRELWSMSILDVTCRQIEYMVEVHRLTDARLVNSLYDELTRLAEHLEKMARLGRRFPIGQEPNASSPVFEVYLNELSNTNNCVLISSAEQKILFKSITNPNYAVSTDPRICRAVSEWFDGILLFGNRLGPNAAKYTTSFFAKLHAQVNASRVRTVTGLRA